MFGHGQFYVGVSRGTDWNRVKVLLERGVKTTNIVYKDIYLELLEFLTLCIYPTQYIYSS